jgi:hypothetical protein
VYSLTSICEEQKTNAINKLVGKHPESENGMIKQEKHPNTWEEKLRTNTYQKLTSKLSFSKGRNKPAHQYKRAPI